jgi:ammonium transporter, Amt family
MNTANQSGPVHIASGSAALAYAIILGRRRGPDGKILPKVPSYRPHNVSMVIIGIVFLWFGWFGFNGGSALNMSMRSIYAANNTNIAAACGLLSWVLLDYVYLGKWSAVGAASGALAGLVGKTASKTEMLRSSDYTRLWIYPCLLLHPRGRCRRHSVQLCH